MVPWLQPQSEITPEESSRGLRMFYLDGVCSQVMGILTGGAFLVALALEMGAGNLVIGILASIGPFSQMLQIPVIFLVDRVRRRKMLAVVNAFWGRLMWLFVAALPWIAPQPDRIPLLILAMSVYFGLGAVVGCAFNSWMRDFIPDERMGKIYAKRMMIAIGMSAILSLLAAAGVDGYSRFIGEKLEAYSLLFLIGGIFGLVGAYSLTRIPEPEMAPVSGKGLFSILLEPFKNSNYRQLLKFLGWWNLSANLAAPFFTVYMLNRLQMDMSQVIALMVLSQIVNVLFLRVWGTLADRLTNKSVLTVSGPLFLVSTLLWPFTTLPEKHFLTMPLLVLIHVLGGMSTAGVTLCAGNVALKAAPRGGATSFLAVNALISGATATLAPLLAGLAADWIDQTELSLVLNWRLEGPNPSDMSMPAFVFKGLDFLFVISALLGLYSIHRLLAVREEGEVEERVVIEGLYWEVRKAVKNVSTVGGLRHLTYFPYQRLVRVLRNRKEEGEGGLTEDGWQ